MFGGAEVGGAEGCAYGAAKAPCWAGGWDADGGGCCWATGRCGGDCGAAGGGDTGAAGADCCAEGGAETGGEEGTDAGGCWGCCLAGGGDVGGAETGGAEVGGAGGAEDGGFAPPSLRVEAPGTFADGCRDGGPCVGASLAAGRAGGCEGSAGRAGGCGGRALPVAGLTGGRGGDWGAGGGTDAADRYWPVFAGGTDADPWVGRTPPGGVRSRRDGGGFGSRGGGASRRGGGTAADDRYWPVGG